MPGIHVFNFIVLYAQKNSCKIIFNIRLFLYEFFVERSCKLAKLLVFIFAESVLGKILGKNSHKPGSNSMPGNIEQHSAVQAAFVIVVKIIDIAGNRSHRFKNICAVPLGSFWRAVRINAFLNNLGKL